MTPGNAGRAKGPWFRGSVERADSGEIGMILETPQGVEKLQTALHVKAKGSPGFRFYLLYDKVYRRDVLQFAYALCSANGGAAGVDGQTFDDIHAYGTDRWLDELAEGSRGALFRRLHASSHSTKTVMRRSQTAHGGSGVRRMNLSRSGGSGFRNPTERSDRWASRRFGIAWCRRLPCSCSNRFSRPTCSRSSTHTDAGRAHWTRFATSTSC